MGELQNVKVRIYGREYSIKSSNDPQTTSEYASYIDNVMRGIAKNTSATDTNRVAVLALLSITHDLFASRRQALANDDEYEGRMRKLLVEIDGVIERGGVQTSIDIGD